MSSLKNISNSELMEQTRRIAREERRIGLDVLHYIREVERRRLYAELGYPSLFEYVTQDLGYSSGSAQRRISSMRLIRDLSPEDQKSVETAIQEARLSMSTLAQAQSHFRSKKKDQKPCAPEEKMALLQELQGKSTQQCERILAELSPEALPRETRRALDGEHTEIRFVANAALLEKLSRLQELLAHHKHGGYAELIHYLADQALKKLDPAERPQKNRMAAVPPSEVKATEKVLSEEQARESAKKSAEDQVEVKPSRYIPVEVAREVRKRDQGRCTYVSSVTGRRCGTRYELEIEHHRPYAMWGSPTDLENLTLHCRAHNLQTAIQAYGVETMGKYLDGVG